jgi:hypothetical protein
MDGFHARGDRPYSAFGLRAGSLRAPRADGRSEIRPAPALLSPTWLIALALLIINDRWLKYADLAPGWLTGKLSDLAGMMVAPVLLAVLLGVRRRGGLLACHVAVALVFAAIKLSPACAQLWSWSMGLLGHPWTIVCDPTDLLALLVLLLSWKALLPYMDPETSPLVPLQRSAIAGLAALGLWSSVATTDRPNVDPPLFYSDVWGQLYINNAGDVPVVFHIRLLREDVRMDCDEVALDPGRLLSPEAFGDATYWWLDPGVNLGLEIPGTDCGAVWIAGDGLAPTIVFIEHAYFQAQLWPGFTQDRDELDEVALGLVTDETGLVEWISGDHVRHVPRTDSLEQPPECEPSPLESRIDWSGEVPEYPAELVAVSAGLDGCFEITLHEWGIDQDGAPAPFGTPYTWYLCVPTTAMPFVAGEFVGFDLMTQSGSGTRELTLTLLDPATLLPALGTSDQPLRQLRLLHGGTGPQFIGPAVDSEFEPVVATECPWRLEPGCATAERVARMREVGTTEAFPPGEPVMFPGGLIDRTMVLTHMRQRAVVDQACTDGANILSYDIDLALVEVAG